MIVFESSLWGGGWICWLRWIMTNGPRDREQRAPISWLERNNVVGPGLSRSNILGSFHPMAGVSEDKDKDDEREDDI